MIPEPSEALVIKLASIAADAKLEGESLDAASRQQLKAAVAELTDSQLRGDVEKLLPRNRSSTATWSR